MAGGSGKARDKDNKENIREFYDKNELLKDRQRISSYERFKKAYLESDPQPKKKESLPPPKVEHQDAPAPQALANNWVIKTDFKNVKNLKGPEEEMKKDSKQIIIVKPNLNMTILQNPQAAEPPKRPASEKKKDTSKDQKEQPREVMRDQLKEAFKEGFREQKVERLSKENRDPSKDNREAKSKELSSGYPDVYLRALK